MKFMYQRSVSDLEDKNEDLPEVKPSVIAGTLYVCIGARITSEGFSFSRAATKTFVVASWSPCLVRTISPEFVPCLRSSKCGCQDLAVLFTGILFLKTTDCLGLFMMWQPRRCTFNESGLKVLPHRLHQHDTPSKL